MKINKRELLKKLIQGNLWKRLSWEETRLYLLLIIFADEAKGTGRLSSKILQECLGSNFLRNQLEKAIHDLEKLHLVKLDISSPGSEIEFEFLRGDKSGSKGKEIQAYEGRLPLPADLGGGKCDLLVQGNLRIEGERDKIH